MTDETLAQPFEGHETAGGSGVSGEFPSFYFEHQAREADFPPTAWQIPGMLPLGLTVCAASPKLGKSFLGQQIEHHLSASQPLFGQVKRDWIGSLVLDMEGNFRRTARRSLMITPDEGDFSCVKYVHANEPSLADVPAGLPRVAWLESYLCNALESGWRFGHVRIDTYRAFFGGRPREANAADWDARLSGALDQLAHRWGLSILVMHHTRKGAGHDDAGDWLEGVGSSFGLTGGATGVWVLERTRGSREGLLKVTTREGEEYELPLWFEAGSWRLQDQALTATQVRRTGCPRAVVDVLTRLGPLPLSDVIGALGYPRDTIRRALGRLAADGDVESVEGLWRLVAEPAPWLGLPAPAEPVGAGSEAPTLLSEPTPAPLVPASATTAAGTPREGPGSRSDVLAYRGEPGVSGAGTGVAKRSAEQVGQGSVPAAGEPTAEPPETGSQGRNPALDALGEAFAASKGHPVPNVRSELRSVPPWSVVGQAWTGRHRWVNPRASEWACDDARTDTPAWHALVLDRNGSYPSVMGSVAVAPNVLTKADATRASELKGLAGVALVEELPAALCAELPDTLDQGVGRGSDRPPMLGALTEGPVWLTAPQWEQALKLDFDLPIVEAWVGKRSTGLFAPFAKWAAGHRAAAREQSQHAYDVAKRQISIAARLLYPKDAGGRFWRPDWWAAIVAEANVRLWAMAVKCEAPLLAVHHVDEVVVAVPADSPDDYVPNPYKLGVLGEYGHVKITGRLPVVDWIANGYTHKQRVRRSSGGA